MALKYLRIMITSSKYLPSEVRNRVQKGTRILIGLSRDITLKYKYYTTETELKAYKSKVRPTSSC